MDWKLLEIFLTSHFGFGPYHAPLWLVGPECNRLGSDPVGIGNRLVSWHRRGQHEMDDFIEFSARHSEKELSGYAGQTKRSWLRLVRLVTTATGKPQSQISPSIDQADNLGRRDYSHACLLDLLNVDANRDRWPFERAPVKYLAGADSCRARFTPIRIRHLRTLIHRYTPSLVIFYDKTHREAWELVAETSFRQTDFESYDLGRRGSTYFMMIRHPESVGTTNRYFDEAGLFARRLLPGQS